MIRKFEYVIISYNNRIDTMRLHQGLLRLGIKNVIVPTPNQISSSCGLSIKANYVNLNKILATINANRLSQNYKLYGEERAYSRTTYIKLK